MFSCSKKEVLVVGKDVPDLHWEGISGIRYLPTSEFNKKYVPPAHKRLQNVVPTEPTFEKVEIQKVKKAMQIETPKIVEEVDEPTQITKTILTHEPVNIFNIDLESVHSHHEYSDEENEQNETIEDFSFVKEEKPIERSVRYSQSAQLANALY